LPPFFIFYKTAVQNVKRSLSSFIQTVLSASEFWHTRPDRSDMSHRIMPCGSWAVPPVGNSFALDCTKSPCPEDVILFLICFIQSITGNGRCQMDFRMSAILAAPFPSTISCIFPDLSLRRAKSLQYASIRRRRRPIISPLLISPA